MVEYSEADTAFTLGWYKENFKEGEWKDGGVETESD